MKNIKLTIISLILLISTTCCSSSEQIKIAFLADVHLHDIYTSLEGENIPSMPLDSDNRRVIIRPMEDQLRSTRMFNENYFAFIAALDDIANRDVDYVVLPGDFSDNGQIYNLTALHKIVDGYSKKYNIEFFITTGNHDPVRPYSKSDVSLSILDSIGARQLIYGKKTENNNSAVSEDVSYKGYAEIVENLSEFGFMPKSNYIYWESPFSSYNYDEYNFETATNEAKLSLREYSEESCELSIPDVSYLVEPIEGLWLLAIDANCYPIQKSTSKNPLDSSNYGSSSDGWNSTIKHKKHLLKWIKSVGERAKSEGKTLIAFSHYPSIDFFNGASSEISALIGDKKMQLTRNPNIEIAEMLSDAGISLHFAGHMHINDTSEHTSKAGNKITNIQIPSLASYSPCYKLLTLNGKKTNVETITIDAVKNFDALFPIYATEYNYLKEKGDKNIWNREILEVTTYKELMEFHLKELVRLRYIPYDWKGVIEDEMLDLTGSEILKSSGIEQEDTAFDNFTLFDMIYDLYRLFNGGSIAVDDIGETRLNQYNSMLKSLNESDTTNPTGDKLIKILQVIDKFAN